MAIPFRTPKSGFYIGVTGALGEHQVFPAAGLNIPISQKVFPTREAAQKVVERMKQMAAKGRHSTSKQTRVALGQPPSPFKKTKAKNAGRGSMRKFKQSLKKLGGGKARTHRKRVDFKDIALVLDKDAGPGVRKKAAKQKEKLSKGRPKLLTIVSQGRRQAHIFAVGKKFETRLVGAETKSFDSFDAAAKFARLRLQELPNPGLGEKVKGLAERAYAKLRGKNNPQSAAEKMYYIFHGLPSAQVLEYRQKEHVHEWLWALGTLTSINVRNQKGTFTTTLKAPDPSVNKLETVVMVCASEDGKQIYFVGGDQSIAIDQLGESFGITEDDIRDQMKIGTVTKLIYRTRKKFEDEGTVNIDFYHALGKEHAEGVLPDLIYRPLDPSIGLVGGRYKVAPFDKQLGASPGVVG